MKRMLGTLFVMFIFCSAYSQDFNTMAGDWIRVKAEYKDGGKLPNNHGSRVIVRYHFTKKEVYQVIASNTLPTAYSRTGNVLKIAPVQIFVIESYTDKQLTLVDAEGHQPVRYYLIPTDSFQVSGRLRYPFEVVDSDTIYSNTPGIEPIYPKGQNEFMNYIMTGFTQKVGFNFSYVVQKDGTIGNVTINASTNPKLNKRLVQLVKKSSGKWIPATYRGKPINVRQNGAISLNSR
jgi:hypothetical protein